MQENLGSGLLGMEVGCCRIEIVASGFTPISLLAPYGDPGFELRVAVRLYTPSTP